MACDLAAGRAPLPGGLIHSTQYWRVEHCVGPLGVGTLIVKTRRHVTRVAELSIEEASEMGPLLRLASSVVDRLCAPEQTYISLWAHSGGFPAHVHYVVQPITPDLLQRHAKYGPWLQVDMYAAGERPRAEDVEVFAERARQLFGR